MLSALTRRLFAVRAPLLVLALIATAAAVWQVRSLTFDSQLEKQLPLDHEFIRTVLDYKDKIAGLNSVNIVVETRKGDIWTPAFMRTLNDVTQEMMYLPGILRESVTSLWTPNTQVYEATEGAVEGRNLIPHDVLPDTITQAQIAKIRDDAFKGGLHGRLFALDSKSAMIQAAVQDTDPATREKTDLIAVAGRLEEGIRKKFENDDVTIRIIGFTKFIGDVSDEARDVWLFFAVAFAVSGLALWYYSRSLALTAITLASSAVAVAWLLAIVTLFDLPLNPLGLIVPFLIYAIGVSHGVQQLNRFLVAVVSGHTAKEAGERAFERLLVPGVFSLMTTLAAFATLLVVPVPFVQDLAIIAVVGMALLFVTNLILLPLAISYVPFGERAVERERRLMEARRRFMAAFTRDVHPLPAVIVLATGAVLATAAIVQAQNARVGHLTPGAAELWSSARYNVDSAAIVKSYDLNLDSFVIVTTAPVDACVNYPVMALVERFGVHMRGVPGVKSVMSLPEASRFVYSIVQEGNLKWRVLPKAPDVLAVATSAISDTTGLRNGDCSLLPIAVFLTDHRDDTLRRVADAARAFIAEHETEGVTFRLATGNGGVLAAINDTVRESQFKALGLIFAVIALLVFVAYRDWRAAVCCVLPIGMATALGLWLMSWFEIGMTVAILPVFVLAVGIGVDYGLYLYERIETHLREGLPMDEAFIFAMREEGTAVVYTALILALGVGCWAFSGLKFQADMGWLLAFLVLANGLAATTVMPALAVILDAVLPRKRQAAVSSSSG